MAQVLSPHERATLTQKIESTPWHPKSPWWRARLFVDTRTRQNLGMPVDDQEGEVAQLPSEPWRDGYRFDDRGMEGPGGGRHSVGGLFPEARGTTAQVPGLYPWIIGSGAPIVGTPLGMDLETGMPVCYDATNWMVRGGFITAPVTMVMALNGFGKSSLVRKMVAGSVAQGRTTLVLGDPKPDYRVLTEQLGGQVIELGYGHGRLNPLDPGAMGAVLARLADTDPDYQRTVLSDVRGRQVTTVAGLIELVRGRAVDDFEVTLLATGIDLLYSQYGFDDTRPPILSDLLELVITGHPELYADAGLDAPEGLEAVALGERDRATEQAQGPVRAVYEETVRPLRRSLNALIRGEFGGVFNGQSTVRVDLDAPAICVDVSLIPQSETKLRAAVLMACWADGMAAVEGAHILSDVGLAPKRTFHVVVEEMWQVLSLGGAMVDRVNEITRLNRGIGTELTMITHTYKDALSLESAASREKARGFFERARVKIIGPIPRGEVELLRDVVAFSDAEAAMVTGWATPEAVVGEPVRRGEKAPAPPGMGKFLLKVGEGSGPGIAFQTVFTPVESASGVHDTNARFAEVNAVRDEEVA